MGLREHVIESMPWCLLPILCEEDFIARVERSLRRATCFRLATWVYDQGLVDFARDLEDHDAFGLPDHDVWIEYRPNPDMPQLGILAMADVHEKTNLVAIMFTYATADGPKIPDEVVAHGAVLKYRTPRDTWYPLSLREPTMPLSGEEREGIRQGFMDNARTLISDLALFVGLLNAKGVMRIVHPAPERLNKQRDRKGKPPLRDIVVLTLPKAGAAHNVGDGTHASPRPHFRRGHVRQLDHGPVLVRPTWVMGEAVKPTYEVRTKV